MSRAVIQVTFRFLAAEFVDSPLGTITHWVVGHANLRTEPQSAPATPTPVANNCTYTRTPFYLRGWLETPDLQRSHARSMIGAKI